MRAVYNGVTIADSDDTIVVEGNHYFPPDSLRWEHLSATRAHSVCPWIGKIRNHVAFWGAVELTDRQVRSHAWQST